jgi:hypothetical protein
MKTKQQLLKRIRLALIFFVTGLVLSGVTAFPLETELNILIQYTDQMPRSIANFITRVYHAITMVNDVYPFLSYGTDWLAFAHLVIAVAFIGPYQNPVQNIWVIEFGIISCLLIFPFAFVCGAIREIPLYWQLIDCSFGLFGLLPLLYAHQLTKKLKALH